MGFKKQTTEPIERLQIPDEEVKRFEKELEDYREQNSQSLMGDKWKLSFYGHPLPDQSKFSGWVMNELLGGVHWSVVKYCLEKGVIRRSKNGIFSFIIIFTNEKKGEIDQYCAYKQFIPKWLALRDLKIRRNHAQEQERERAREYDELKTEELNTMKIN